MSFFLCRGTRIRTWDLLLPKRRFPKTNGLINNKLNLSHKWLQVWLQVMFLSESV